MLFRIFPLDNKGHYLPPEVLECDTDEAAVAAAGLVGERLKDGFDVWQFSRFVGRFVLGPDGTPIRDTRKTEREEPGV